MKIYFERSGGFMGLRMSASFDTTELPEEDAEALRELLEEADFFELPERLESGLPGMDQFSYVLSVTLEDTREIRAFVEYPAEEDMPEAETQPEARPLSHTVEFTDAAAPTEMQSLTRMLMRLARGQG